MKIFNGGKLFDLYDSSGLPLNVSISKIINLGYTISWIDFIITARQRGWWDFRTIEVLSSALEDSDVDKLYKDGVVARSKLFMLSNPL